MSDDNWMQECKLFIMQAIEEEKAGKYESALLEYEQAIQILLSKLENEKRADKVSHLQQKINEYSQRVKHIKRGKRMHVAADIIKLAVIKDNAQKYHHALCLYAQGIHEMQIAASSETNPNHRAMLDEKMEKYIKRVNDLKNCYPYLQDMDIKELNKHMLQNTKTGSYSWKIPHLCSTNIAQLCTGYIRNHTPKYIPHDIIHLCQLFYDMQLLPAMKSAKNEEHFTSDTFNIGPFKWRIKIYPNGQKDSRKGHVILFLKLISLSPAIEQITYYYNISMVEANVSHCGFDRLFHGHLTYGWPKQTLLLKDIQSLHSMTYNVDITILKITGTNKECYKYGSKPLPMQNMSIAHNYGLYKWNISDADTINKIKNAVNMAKYESDVFKAVGFKWYLDFYPNGVDEEDIHNSRFYLNILSIPTNIESIVVDYSLICKELDINRSWGPLIFGAEDRSSGLDDDMQIFSKLGAIQSLTFEVVIQLIDVYDYNGDVITAKYENDNETQCKFCITDSYEWNISEHIDIDKIKSAKDGEVFYSEMFCIKPFKMIMKLTPNIYLGPPQTKPSCNWHLYLVSFPPQITEINLRHKVRLRETNTVHSEYWIFKMGLFKSVAMWGCGTLYFHDIQHVNSLTIDLDVDILDIYDKNGNNIYDVAPLELPLTMTSGQHYEWFIGDVTKLESMKAATNGTVYESTPFMLHGLQWHLELFPNGKKEEERGSVMLSIHLNRFVEQISSISFHFELLFVETNTLSSSFAHFNETFTSTGWTKYRLNAKQIKDLQTFTIRVMIQMVDVFRQ